VPSKGKKNIESFLSAKYYLANKPFDYLALLPF